jgi:hypothetical protein
MADIRFNSLPTTAASTASDDFLAIDGSANGTRKLNAYSPTFGGNVGIGAAASTWDLSALQVQKGSIYGTGNETGYYANANYNGGWKYIASAAASGYLQNGGTHQWYVAGSGTAGNAITFTKALEIDANSKLTVTGNLTVSGSNITGTTYLRLNANSGTNYINLDAGGSGTGDRLYTSGDFTLQANGEKSVFLVTNGVTRATFNSTATTLANNLTVSGAGNSITSSAANSYLTTGAFGTVTGMDSGASLLGMNMYGATGHTFKYLTSSGIGYAGIALGSDGSDAGNITFFTGTGAGTANATFTPSVAMKLESTGNLLLGAPTDGGNGKLQLADHTAKEGGIGFGPDTCLYRTAEGVIAIDDVGVAGTAQLALYQAGAMKGLLATVGDSVYLDARAGSGALYFRTNGTTTALTLDSSQRCILAGALRLNNAYVSGAPTATGYVTLQDSAGNTYKVLVGT